VTGRSFGAFGAAVVGLGVQQESQQRMEEFAAFVAGLPRKHPKSL